MDITKSLKDWLVENANVAPVADIEIFKSAVSRCLKDGSLSPQKYTELTSNSPNAKDVFGGGGFRVKNPSERYSTTKSVGKHSKSGLPVRDEKGKEVELPSELENAKIGCLLKHLASKQGISNVVMNEHEEMLLHETCEKDSWYGEINGKDISGLPMTKGLLDDVTSGGMEIVPEFFDANIITFPLLHGELFPLVDLQEVPRGRKVEAASVGNPSLTWGTAEGSAISVFDTAALIAAIDTTIFPVVSAIEIGLDFLADSPADIGRILTQNLGQKLMEELDDVIASGNGTTQPQGILNASGLTTKASENGVSGAPTVADYEGLMFSVGKQYRNSGMRPCFIGNDVTYSRARGIAVGASDQRRVFGMNEQSYSLLEHPFKVQNDIGNSSLIFGALKKYRMYRRSGQSIKFETGGKELSLNNLGLLIVRSRFGGKVVDSNAFAKMTDAQS